MDNQETYVASVQYMFILKYIINNINAILMFTWQ